MEIILYKKNSKLYTYFLKIVYNEYVAVANDDKGWFFMSNKYLGRKIQKVVNVNTISNIHYFEFNDDFVDVSESHAMWEMVYIDRGECNIIADDNTILLHQGEVYFHKPFEKHMIQVIKGISSNVFIVAFESSSAAMRFFEDKVLQVNMNTKQHITAIIHEASNTFDLPGGELHGGELKFKSHDVLWGGEQTVLIRFELMLIELIRANNKHIVTRSASQSRKDLVEDDFCLKIIEYMESHISEKLSMDELSRAMSFSKSYISKRFAAACGCSVIDYFTIMKIDEAKRLIRESNKNFFEISDMLMFSNSHYFSTVFKKHVGVTPTEYKRNCSRG